MRALAQALLVALLALVTLPAAAGAHATVLRTTPSDGAVLPSAPRAVQMRFTEPVDLGPGSLRLLDASGKEIDTDDARHAGGARATAVLTLPRGLESGTYVVAWRVTSADSHPVSGAFSFSIGEPSAAVLPGQESTSRLVEAFDAIARGVAFLGLALALGGACVLLRLWPEGPASGRGRRFLWTGVGLLAGGTFAVLVLQGPYATGEFSLSFTLSTWFGQALLARLVLTVAFAVLVARALERPTRGLTVAASACAVGILATWTLTDHSRTGVQTWLGVPAATVHLLAMALWLGGLALLLVCVLGRGNTTLEPVLPRFSRLALICFAALGVTGVYLAWRQSGAPAALPATDFGKLLLVKSAIVLVIIGLASLSRRAVAGMGGDVARRLRRTVLAEVALGVVVLGVTATLVNAEPARVAYAPPLDVTVPGPDGGRVQLHMDRAKQGENVVDIYLLAKGGGLVVPPEVTARLAPPEGEDVGALPVELVPAEPGHYVAPRMTVPFPGRWTLELSVRTSDVDEVVYRLPVRIR
jgi:copper transport protein